MDRTPRLGGTAPLVDLAVGVALVVLGQAEVWAGEPTRTAVALAAVSTAPLVVRRRVPVVVLLVTLGCLTVLTLRREDTFTVAQLLGLMLATYTVARTRPAPAAAGWLGLTLAAALANSTAVPGTSAGDYVFPVILLAVPWAAGVGLRGWQLRAEELRILTDELRSEREAHARLAISAERGRIARDLHDSVAQTLNAVVIHAEAAAEALDRDPGRAAGSLARIQEIGRSSLAETRELLAALRSDDDMHQPRLDQLDRLVADVRRSGLEVSLTYDRGTARLPASTEAAVYRIVQESLNNVVKHARARHAWVSVRVTDDVEVEVRDDGRGDAAGALSGLGILGMRERVQLVGGSLTAGPAENGWTVRARIPAAAVVG